MQTPSFVSGPFDLNERSLVVNSPDVAVLFKNGLAFKVLPPGVYRMITGGLPFFGQQVYLLFDAAPFGFTISVADICLRDNSIVGVEAKVWVEPTWLSDTNAIFSYAEMFGLRAERYLETVEDALHDKLRRQILNQCAHLNHDQFIASDLGRVLRLDQIHTDLARVARTIGVTAIQDTNVVTHIRTIQGIGNQSIADEYQLGLDRRRALAQAEINTELAKIYDVNAWAVAHPDAANRLRLEAARALRELATEFRDMLSPEELRQVDSIVFDVTQGNSSSSHPVDTQSQSEISAPKTRFLDGNNSGRISAIQAIDAQLRDNPSVLIHGRGVRDSASGTIACIAVGMSADEVPITDPDGFALEHGLVELNIIVVTQFDTPATVALELLDKAFSQHGMPAGEVHVSVSGKVTSVVISLTGIVSEPERVAQRLLCWSDALAEMVAPHEIQVDVR